MIAEETEIHSTGLLFPLYFTRFGPISTMTFLQVSRTKTPPPPPPPLLLVPLALGLDAFQLHQSSHPRVPWNLDAWQSSVGEVDDALWRAFITHSTPVEFDSTFQGFSQTWFVSSPWHLRLTPLVVWEIPNPVLRHSGFLLHSKAMKNVRWNESNVGGSSNTKARAIPATERLQGKQRTEQVLPPKVWEMLLCCQNQGAPT